ncbi:MAG: polysaccharide biosynthesis C-terminal domain-containing protein [Desulfobacula sp.]|nr:polysaccharide biosynthesis C-terminal domain-containing protein [Desulfobacula sp.]
MPKTYYISFIKDNCIVFCGAGLVRLQHIILMPIMIKAMGVTIYGGFTLLSSILGIAVGISSFGVGFRAKRFLPSVKSIRERRDLFYPQFYFNMISILSISLCFIFFQKQINTYLFKNEITFSTWIIPLYLFVYIFYSQGITYFRYTSRIFYMRLINVCFSYSHIGFILVYLHIYRSISLNIVVFFSAFSAFLFAIPSFWVICREIGVKFSFYNLKSLKDDIKLGFPLVLGFIVDFILAGSDRYFIAFYMTVSAVGYYNPGYVMCSLIVFIPKAMGTALPQLMSRAVDSKNEYEAQRMLNYVLKIFLLLAIPFIFGSMVLGKPVLTLLANREVAENTYLVTPLVALGSLFYGLNIILSNVLFVRMKTNAIFKMNLFASVFNLLANLILLYFFRYIIVAAITTLVSYFLAFIYVNKIVKKEAWPVDFQPVVIIKSVAASLVMVALLFWVSSKAVEANSVGMLAVELILGIVVYVVFLFAIRAFSKKELQFVKSCFYR